MMTIESPYKANSEIFICPITGQKLNYVCDHGLMKWNDLISRGEVSDLCGNMIREPLEEAFVSDDEGLLYPIMQGILMILPESACVLACDAKKWQISKDNKKIKQVQKFYNDLGWESQGEHYVDAKDSEDLRHVSKNYIHDCHVRVNQFLPQSGEYLLDIASGPVQYDEYLDYSKNFTTRICADISIKALLQAKARIGEQGLFVLCDVTKLPFKTNTLDACVSLHTLYHVPEQEQLRAFAQLHRVLKASGQAVVVYSWGKHSLLMKLFLGPLKLLHRLIKFFTFSKSQPNLYFHAYNYTWFKKVLKKRFAIELYAWRSVNVPFMKIFVHSWLGGKFLLKLFYVLENKYPKLMGRIGAYPLFVIKKSKIYHEPHSV